MEEKMTEMPFGVKMKFGNYTVLKYAKTLSKREVANLREGIPQNIRKHLQRGKIPYIKVEAISGVWAIEFCCNTQVYRLIDQTIAECDEKHNVTLVHIFNMWYMDTCIPGDEEYQEDKAKAMKAFMGRIKAENPKNDAEILDDVKDSEEAKAKIQEIAEHLKDGDDGGK